MNSKSQHCVKMAPIPTGVAQTALNSSLPCTADAARRDLTINAMFKDPISGQLFDFFGGKHDIENKILRAVGNPDERLAEDRLRMLRVTRFMARYNEFSVAPELIESIKKNAYLINGDGTDKYPKVSENVNTAKSQEF